MPIAIAPERFTLAFSSNTTRAPGSRRFALYAAIGPAVPPPITKTSHATSVRPFLISSMVVTTGRPPVSEFAQIGPGIDATVMPVGEEQPQRIIADRFDGGEVKSGPNR